MAGPATTDAAPVDPVDPEGGAPAELGPASAAGPPGDIDGGPPITLRDVLKASLTILIAAYTLGVVIVVFLMGVGAALSGRVGDGAFARMVGPTVGGLAAPIAVSLVAYLLGLLRMLRTSRTAHLVGIGVVVALAAPVATIMLARANDLPVVLAALAAISFASLPGLAIALVAWRVTVQGMTRRA